MANERRLIDIAPYENMVDASVCQIQVYRSGNGYCDVMNFNTKNIPTLDAVEVCFCKECKYWEPIQYGHRTDGLCFCLSKYHDAERPGTEGNFYCAYGKKSGTRPQREDV